MRFLRIVASILVLALLLSACGPAAPNNADEITPSGHRFKLGLPRLIIDFDEQGQPSLLGLTAAQLEALTGMPVSSMALDQATLEKLASAGVQHIELAHSEAGIFLFVNGKPLPHLSWNGQVLGNIGPAAAMFGVPFASLLETLAPLIQRTGLSLVLRFPLPSGATEVPLRDVSAMPEEAIAEAGPSKLLAIADVDIGADGVPVLAGVNFRELAQFTGLNLAAVQLSPQLVSQLQAGGVREIQIMTRPEGIFITVNGMALPHIAWSKDSLMNSVDLYSKFDPENPLVAVAKLVVPDLDKADVDLLIRLPAP